MNLHEVAQLQLTIASQTRFQLEARMEVFKQYSGEWDRKMEIEHQCMQAELTALRKRQEDAIKLMNETGCSDG